MTGTKSLLNCTSNSTISAPYSAAFFNDAIVFSRITFPEFALKLVPDPRWPTSSPVQHWLQYRAKDCFNEHLPGSNGVIYNTRKDGVSVVLFLFLFEEGFFRGTQDNLRIKIIKTHTFKNSTRIRPSGRCLVAHVIGNSNRPSDFFRMFGMM